MTYEQQYFRRVINKQTKEFIRDIDLNYDTLLENEEAIYAPACVGDKRIAHFDNNGNFIEWGN